MLTRRRWPSAPGEVSEPSGNVASGTATPLRGNVANHHGFAGVQVACVDVPKSWIKCTPPNLGCFFSKLVLVALVSYIEDDPDRQSLATREI